MNVTEIIGFVQNNALAFGQIVTSMVGIASIIVKMTPTLKDDTVMKKVIKFVGKFIALNNSISALEQKKVNKK